MNCFNHTEMVAVGSCSRGCGKALCKSCMEEHAPPSCDECNSNAFAAAQINQGKRKSKLMRSVLFHGFLFCAYLVGAFGYFGPFPQDSEPAQLCIGVAGIILMPWALYVLFIAPRRGWFVYFGRGQYAMVYLLMTAMLMVFAGAVMVPYMLYLDIKNLRGLSPQKSV